MDCSGLTEVIIPNSVTSIESEAFSGCSSLTNMTIGNSVKSIGYKAFEGCSGLTTLYSLSINPPAISESFTINHYVTVDVYVPKVSLEAYQIAVVWKEFRKLQGFGEAKKCATPTIHYANNTLTFECETEGVTYESTIRDADISYYSSSKIQLSMTYNISVRATKKGYEDSDVATATLCWIDAEPKTDGIVIDVAQVRANAVLIQASNGQIDITGLEDNTKVTVYDINGVQVGSGVSNTGQISINANITPGSVAIVKIGDRSVKVVVK